MLLSAHQNLYLPHVPFFDKLDRADVFCLFDIVQFDPHDYQNKNRIKTKDGSQLLTVPVKGGRNQLIKDVQIDNGNWKRKHLRAISLAYSKAPHFEHYFRFLKYAYSDANVMPSLARLNEQLIRWACRELGITTPIVSASDYDFKGKKSDLVLDMCIKLKATEYIFGEQGESYCDKQAFLDAGVKPVFQSYQHPTYSQLHGEFIPKLSIVDLLMNAGQDSLEILRNATIKS